MKPLLTVLVVLQLLIATSALSAENSLSRSLFTKLSTRIGSPPADISSIIPLDINRDGIDELVLFEAGVGIHVYQHNCLDFIAKLPPQNLTSYQEVSNRSNNSAELMISAEDSTAVHLISVTLSCNRDFSKFNAVFDTIFSESLNDSEQVTVGKPILTAALDANGDGTRDYLALRSYGLHEKYRGILLIDGKTKSEVWHRYMGPLPQKVQLCNLDGERRIIVSSCAVDNGRAADGYTDSASYLFAFTLDGRDFWPPILIGGKLSRHEYQLIPDNNGTDTNIVVTTYNMNDSEAIQSIRIFSGRTGKLMHEYWQAGGFRTLRVCDMRADSSRSIIAISQSGKVFSFDSSLHVEQIRDLPESATSMLPPVDCTGDSTREYPVLTSDNMLWILDSQLTPIYSRQLGSRLGWLAPMAGPKANEREILCVAEHPYIMTFYWGAKSFSEIVPPVVQIAIVLSSLAALLVGYLQIRHRREYFEFLDSIFNDSSRAIIALDVNRSFSRTNSMADQLFDAKRLLLGRNADALAKHRTLSPLFEIVDSFLASDSQRSETVLQLLIENKPREFAVSICRGTNSQSNHAKVTIIMLQDITVLSQAKLYSAWSQVASGLAHDLRKPLAPVKLLLQDLLARIRGRETSLEAISGKYLDPALMQVDRMTRYIDQLAAAANSKDAPREKLCVAQFIEDVLKLIRDSEAQYPPIKLVTAGNLPNIMANPNDFERVISELIDNAVKATRDCPSPEITFNLRLSDRQSGHICIEVKDNGRGISPEALPYIFEPHVTTGGKNHRGLGLWTTRKIITEHGGTIEVQSQVGVGTVFVIDLPGQK